MADLELTMNHSNTSQKICIKYQMFLFNILLQIYVLWWFIIQFWPNFNGKFIIKCKKRGHCIQIILKYKIHLIITKQIYM